jgi:hypothetical protein
MIMCALAGPPAKPTDYGLQNGFRSFFASPAPCFSVRYR